MINFTNVIDIVYQAGKRLKPHFGNVQDIISKENLSTRIITKLDQQTEMFLEDKLKKLDSSIGYKGEEFGSKLTATRFWLVDPIDGSGFFTRGVWGCTVMLALIENAEITFSVIYDFVLDEMYYAKKGEGAYVNKKRVRVSDKNLKNALLYVESDLSSDENTKTYIALCKSFVVLGMYPSGIHFALTAAGKVEGRIVYNGFGKDYDFAPGQLLVQEAGGVVANIGTQSFDYRNLNFLAVNQEVYKELTTGINPIFPIKE